MTTSGFNPLTIIKGVAGGVNGRDTFGRYLDDTLFKGATFADLRRSRIKTWINATDMANNTPFLFSPETFDALCSDLSRVRLSEAVAASAAFPLVFTPIVLEAHQGKCTYREPDWLTAARYNPEATAAMRAHARALESYTNPDEVKFVKLLDGGITDNFGTTGLAVERARAQVPYAPLTAEEAVKLKRMLFLVANAGVRQGLRLDPPRRRPGRRQPRDVHRHLRHVRRLPLGLRFHARRTAPVGKSELIEWRCALPLAEVRKLARHHRRLGLQGRQTLRRRGQLRLPPHRPPRPARRRPHPPEAPRGAGRHGHRSRPPGHPRDARVQRLPRLAQKATTSRPASRTASPPEAAASCR
jgi:hypothetical protein